MLYVEQILAPTLKKGQIVFLDNVSTHKVDGVEEAIEARGACAVFLPAYSPDLNPIEQLFARLKSFLRKMKARTVEQLWKDNKLASEWYKSYRQDDKHLRDIENTLIEHSLNPKPILDEDEDPPEGMSIEEEDGKVMALIGNYSPITGMSEEDWKEHEAREQRPIHRTGLSDLTLIRRMQQQAANSARALVS